MFDFLVKTVVTGVVGRGVSTIVKGIVETCVEPEMKTVNKIAVKVAEYGVSGLVTTAASRYICEEIDGVKKAVTVIKRIANGEKLTDDSGDESDE